MILRGVGGLTLADVQRIEAASGAMAPRVDSTLIADLVRRVVGTQAVRTGRGDTPPTGCGRGMISVDSGKNNTSQSRVKSIGTASK